MDIREYWKNYIPNEDRHISVDSSRNRRYNSHISVGPYGSRHRHISVDHSGSRNTRDTVVLPRKGHDNTRENKDENDNKNKDNEIIKQLKILNENIVTFMSNNKNPCVISKKYKNEKKVCEKCGKEKDISEFNMLRQKRVNKNGEIVIYEYKQSRCKECSYGTSVPTLSGHGAAPANGTSTIHE